MEGVESEEAKMPKAGGEPKKEESLNLGSGKESEKNGVHLWTATSSRPTVVTSSGPNTIMPSPNQLTVFYGGKVFVFDGIPEEKVREIMLIATTAAAAKAGEIKTDSIGSPGAPILTRSPSLQSTASALASPQAQLYPISKPSLCNFQAGLPIARRHSLQRFFEKRRDRLVSKNPYPSPTAGKMAETAKPEVLSEAPPSVGCFGKPLAHEEEVKMEVTGSAA